jgi:DNA-binding NarL/FixJ family response regulator
VIRILIVDDHPVFRAGLANLLESEPDFLVVGKAANGHAAVQLWEQKQPHILLLDLSMPGISGLETLRRIQMMSPDAKAIVLTSSESADDADRALQAGARGYLTKHIDQEEIVAAIRRVNAGQVFVQPGLIASPAIIAHAGPAGVSSREMEVLVFLRKGFSNAQIGRTLGITERTVKAHVGALMKKLNAADRAEVVARGFDLGILKAAHSPGGDFH